MAAFDPVELDFRPLICNYSGTIWPILESKISLERSHQDLPLQTCIKSRICLQFADIYSNYCTDLILSIFTNKFNVKLKANKYTLICLLASWPFNILIHDGHWAASEQLSSDNAGLSVRQKDTIRQCRSVYLSVGLSVYLSFQYICNQWLNFIHS